MDYSYQYRISPSHALDLLKEIRRDATHRVYATRARHVTPPVLCEALRIKYGLEHYEITLRDELYMVYVDQEAIKRIERDEKNQDPERREEPEPIDAEAPLERNLMRKEGTTVEERKVEEKMESYMQKYWDVKLAEHVLRKEEEAAWRRSYWR